LSLAAMTASSTVNVLLAIYYIICLLLGPALVIAACCGLFWTIYL
jgi:hypothetical protein